MALAEPGRFEDGAGDPDPSLLHISMVFVRPTAQRTGVGLLLVLHILDIARSMGFQRVGVWTAQENSPARKLYERAGMTLTGKTAPLRSSLALQYESFLQRRGSVAGLGGGGRLIREMDGKVATPDAGCITARFATFA